VAAAGWASERKEADMASRNPNLQQDPAEGAREAIEHDLAQQDMNQRESGARKLDERRKKIAKSDWVGEGDQPEDIEDVDRPGFDLGGAEDRGKRQLRNPVENEG
jgi:hypothetical protein